MEADSSRFASPHRRRARARPRRRPSTGPREFRGFFRRTPSPDPRWENHVRERVRKAYGTIRARRRGIPMKAKLQRVECDEEDLIEVPDSWIPVRLEHNAYATPAR